MTQKILRGRILTFVAEPQSPQDETAHLYIEDGALLIADGLIKARGDFADLAGTADPGIEVIDHRPNLLMPGFIDTHLHFPQVQVIASWGAQLLDWLTNYTFPAESRYADPVHAATMARHFFDALLANGTTTRCGLLLVTQAIGGGLFRGSGTTQHAGDWRQGADGSQRTGHCM